MFATSIGPTYDVLVRVDQDGQGDGYIGFIVSTNFILLAVDTNCYYEHLQEYSGIGTTSTNRACYKSAHYEGYHQLYISKADIKTQSGIKFGVAECIEIRHARQFVGHRVARPELEIIRQAILTCEETGELSRMQSR